MHEMAMIPAERRRRVAAAVKKAGAEALLVTHLPDVRYLTGFTGSSAALIVKGSRVTMFTDGRYTTQAANEVDGAKIVITDKPAAVAACEFAVEQGVTKCAFDAQQTTVETLEKLRQTLPARARKSWFVAASGLVAALRQIKDEIEQDRMREAAAMGCRLFEQVLEDIKPGATEMEVALALEFMARLAGAEKMSFDTIVAGGERSALPHGKATNTRLPRRGFVTLDFGVVVDGYCSDMTRTVHLGPARKGEREVYDAVLDAQLAGIAAVKAGVTGEQVDAAARDVLVKAGLAEWFTHGTGHGVGLEIHEWPRLGKKREGSRDGNTDVKLKAGMVVTIEPGVYLPGRFGVRIEDSVLVTATGCEILTPVTKAWIEL
jgi:Xaa-Pro aminopeptidase